jgi:hypothetical protein
MQVTDLGDPPFFLRRGETHFIYTARVYEVINAAFLTLVDLIRARARLRVWGRRTDWSQSAALTRSTPCESEKEGSDETQPSRQVRRAGCLSFATAVVVARLANFSRILNPAAVFNSSHNIQTGKSSCAEMKPEGFRLSYFSFMRES